MTDSQISDDNQSNNDRAQLLTETLAADPYDFKAYRELIEIHRGQGNLPEVRSLRERVQQYYMLPEQMWCDWLKDEIMCEGADQNPVNIPGLFTKALADYNYLRVRKKYCKYALK